MQNKYILENDRIKIEVLSHGAELCSLTQKGTATNFMWSGDPAVWGKFSPILFPAIGMVKGGEYSYNGKHYPMTKHGFIRDLDFTDFNREINRLRFRFTSTEETYRIYPFRFNFTVVYELVDSKVLVDYIVKNEGTVPMHFALGGHTAFSTELEGTELSDYVLEFEEPLDLNAHMVDTVTGLVKHDTVTLGSRVKELPLSKKMFDGDAYIFRDIPVKSVKLKCVRHDKTVRVCYDDFNTLAIWSMKGKGNFICIEPWTSLPDFEDGNGVLTDKPDIVTIPAGEKLRFKYTIKVQ